MLNRLKKYGAKQYGCSTFLLAVDFSGCAGGPGIDLDLSNNNRVYYSESESTGRWNSCMEKEPMT